jgi:hypothetical protein
MEARLKTGLNVVGQQVSPLSAANERLVPHLGTRHPQR